MNTYQAFLLLTLRGWAVVLKIEIKIARLFYAVSVKLSASIERQQQAIGRALRSIGR